jgi:hypothetical protein
MFKTGFTAGLQIWLIFLLVLFALKYPPLFCILMGAIAGLAGGVITGFLQAENQISPTSSDAPGEQPLWLQRLQQFQQAQKQRTERRKNRNKGWYSQRPKPRSRR